MTGILLFIVLPLVLLIVGGLLIALLTGPTPPGNDRRGGVGGFLDWLL